jgi:hypothetical protein
MTPLTWAVTSLLLAGCTVDRSDFVATNDSLRLHLDVPHTVRVGEPVPIVFRIENARQQPLDLYLRGREIAFDIVISDRAGRVVWRRLAGEVIPAILRIETLGPGGVLTLEHLWDQRTGPGRTVPPGDYTVRAELLTENEPLHSPAVPLRILTR